VAKILTAEIPNIVTRLFQSADIKQGHICVSTAQAYGTDLSVKSVLALIPL
jgi:hypothetical protein